MHRGAAGTKPADVAPLRLRCPSCGRELGAMPTFPGSVQCGQCKFRIVSDGDWWDACVDESYPRDFARQWVLWEEGRLGDRSLVYGEKPERYFRELLSGTSLRPEQLASKNVLEIGYGHGRLLRQIQVWSPSAFGIDLAKPLRSADLRPGSAIFGSLLNIPFVPGQFDLVVCRGVIHVTPDPETSFGCVADQVAADGMLYLAGCYEPGKGMLALRRILPWSWRYPESLRLGLASIFSGLRSVVEGIRSRKMDWRTLRRHYDHYKLDVFDVMAPRWTCTLDAETVEPWFASRGFQVRKVSYGAYVGVKAGALPETGGCSAPVA